MNSKKLFVIIPFFALLILFLSSLPLTAEASSGSGDILSALFGQEESEEFSKVLPLKADGTFSLKNVNGSVTITTWKEDKVDIEAIKTTKGDPGKLKEVKIEVEATANSVSVNTIFPRGKNIRVSVNYKVKVPQGVNLGKVKSTNGSVYITGPVGNTNASTTNGRIELDGAKGTISLSSTNGRIEAVNIRGELDVDTTNGTIVLEMLSFEDTIKAKSTNGSITLRIGSLEKVNADFNARTTNGSISLDLPVTLKSMKKSRRSLEGQIGQGGPEISLRTTNGSIKITK
ncbi:hypothetical protein LCGC14_0779260 [marine sediment metagenome]|uniref:DUF4097 domain-containing protein n=1 Tax=marine sediment metagenome TaxID=412755 RepID=A0A0F9QFW5_9ZZZZ|nr:hypothetical protein [Candidatus Aminicenantes bacterium]HEB35053.1 hypothetical protein [Candidatus Aminicenantes bacterium]